MNDVKQVNGICIIKALLGLQTCSTCFWRIAGSSKCIRPSPFTFYSALFSFISLLLFFLALTSAALVFWLRNNSSVIQGFLCKLEEANQVMTANNCNCVKAERLLVQRQAWWHFKGVDSVMKYLWEKNYPSCALFYIYIYFFIPHVVTCHFLNWLNQSTLRVITSFSLKNREQCNNWIKAKLKNVDWYIYRYGKAYLTDEKWHVGGYL